MQCFNRVIRKYFLIAIMGSFFASTALVHADVRESKVPDTFLSAYVGFTSVSNTDITISGDDASWVGLSGGNFSVDLNNLEQENAIWGGMAFGHWFKQAPVSLGISFATDIYPAVIKEQTLQNVAFTVDGVPGSFTSFTKFRTRVLQVVPAVNFLVGVPLKFVRLYAGVGPGMFFSFYSFDVKSSGVKVGNVTATDVSIGYNAFAGVDVFISRHFSVYLEGKFSQVNNLKFEPASSNSFVAGRTVSDEFDKIATQRIGIGLTYYFGN